MCSGDVICFCSKQIRKEFSDNIIFINDVNIGRAVRASCSFPIVFSPCDFNGTKLIDGGIRENVAWKELKFLGADKVLNITFDDDIDEDCSKNIIVILLLDCYVENLEIMKWRVLIILLK